MRAENGGWRAGGALRRLRTTATRAALGLLLRLRRSADSAASAWPCKSTAMRTHAVSRRDTQGRAESDPAGSSESASAAAQTALAARGWPWAWGEEWRVARTASGLTGASPELDAAGTIRPLQGDKKSHKQHQFASITAVAEHLLASLHGASLRRCGRSGGSRG